MTSVDAQFEADLQQCLALADQLAAEGDDTDRRFVAAQLAHVQKFLQAKQEQASP